MAEQQIISTVIEDEMKTSYLDYSMSVIVGRALPDAKDGLKPVHRRILYAMYKEGLHYNKKHSKCAGVVGEVLKKYHPHGDSSVYDALVRMAQSWSLRYPLVDGQGNFGNQDGDMAAAYRYTESRLRKIAEELLLDIDKDTVDFVDNFDGQVQEPVVLPAKIPNLLINGSSGIAVGMATNIPPHNVSEVCNGAIALLENPDIDYIGLMEHVKGPDFPTGGIICGTAGIRSAYKHGTGKIIVRAKCVVEEKQIIIAEIPYMVNKGLLLKNIATLVRDKRVEGISNLRDESDRNGMRIVIELKRDVQGEVVLNQLYKHTQLQTTFGTIMLALVDKQPKVLSLKDMLQVFLDHRKEIVERRTQFELTKAQKRAHILEGLRIALDHIDAVIALIKASSDAAVAKTGLMETYTLSAIQAQAILDMKLQRLTSLEQDKINTEYDALMELIADLQDILATPARVVAIIKDELMGVADAFADARRSEILVDFAGDIEDEDLIEEDDVVITVTHSGYVKRVPLDTYRAQRRGGKGIVATGTRSEDFVEHVFVAHTHSHVLFFTNTGRVHWLKAYRVPEGSRYAKGTSLVNLLRLQKGERVQAMIPVREFSGGQYLIMATRNGTIKKTALELYSRPRQGGIIAVTLREGDELVTVKLTDGDATLLIATADGRAVKCHESDIRAIGRSGSGVRGIRIRDSFVVGMEICDAPYVLTVTEHGYGKRSAISDYRLINRGGSGVINLKVTAKTGAVVGIRVVNAVDDVMFISKKGIIIRTPTSGISVIGRNTQGVRVMRLGVADSLMSVAHIVGEEELVEEAEQIEAEKLEAALDEVASDAPFNGDED